MGGEAGEEEVGERGGEEGERVGELGRLLMACWWRSAVLMTTSSGFMALVQS